MKSKVDLLLICMALLGCTLMGCAMNSSYEDLIEGDDLVFEENFESGDISSLKFERANDDAFAVVDDPTNADNRILRVMLQAGDMVNNGNRAEFKR